MLAQNIAKFYLILGICGLEFSCFDKGYWSLGVVGGIGPNIIPVGYHPLNGNNNLIKQSPGRETGVNGGRYWTCSEPHPSPPDKFSLEARVIRYEKGECNSC